MSTPVDLAERARDAFRERARLEAARYGSDAWIFVRELLQNARDAGARRVQWTIAQVREQVIVTCTDDGEGMDFEHARRYLFSLYTSSKEHTRDQIGCFGVGFWSILRFAPNTILIASRRRNFAPWEIQLDGELRHASERNAVLERGTRVVLVRDDRADEVRRQITRAAQQHARYLTCRHDGETPLAVTIDGNPINEAFALPCPSSEFRRGKLRGVVSLGKTPRVELLSGGLLVRAAVDLDELESKEIPSQSTLAVPLPGGLSPVILLDSPSLELLLARRDARQSASLRRLVRLARRELRLLVARQIDQTRPPSVLERIRGWWDHVFRDQPRRQFTAAALLTVSLGVWVIASLWPALPQRAPAPIVASRPSSSTPFYRDVANYYRGPQVTALGTGSSRPPIDLRYHPASARPYLRVLALEQFDTIDAGVHAPTTYRSSPCPEPCTSIELRYGTAPGYMRVPVPSGERLDTASLRVDGRAMPVYRTKLDEPVLYFAEPRTGTMSYRTSAAAPQDVAPGPSAISLPPDLLQFATEARERPLDDKVAMLRAITQSRVAYRTDTETATAHEHARAQGEAFVERALGIAAGDCDVLNGLFTALLQAAGVHARLAIGYVGTDGRVHSDLHAWVEYRDGSGPWLIGDATEGAAGEPSSRSPSLASRLPPGGAPAAGSIRPNEPPAAATVSAPTARELEPLPPSPALADGQPTTEPSVSDRENSPRTTPTNPPVLDLGSDLSSNPDTLFAWSTFQVQNWRDPLQASLLLALLGLAGWRWRRRTTREVALSEQADIAAMLTGALQRPELFRELPAVMDRPLVPVLRGRDMTLREAMATSSKRRLFCASGPNALTRRVPAIDTNTPEGTAVAESLAAIDLDRWHQWIATAQALPVFDALAQLARDRGERWLVRGSRELERPFEMLDLHALGQRMHGCDRVVLISLHDPRVVELCERWTQQPATARFALADLVFSHLDLTDERRRQLLAAGARDVLHEAMP